MVRTFLIVVVASIGLAQARAQSVVFINPGKADELYWATATSALEAAARDLEMRLEVRYAERDLAKTIEIGREVASRPPASRPEYAIVTNDSAAGPRLLKIFDGAGIKTVFAYSSPSAADRADHGGPRERYPGWLGSIEPRSEDAGYLTGLALIERGRQAKLQGADGRIHILAIAGDRTTPASIRLNRGLQQAATEAGNVVIDQVVYGNWNLAKSEEQASWLFKRYPNTRLVWAGNDLMALGAMKAWEARGGAPGRDAWFSAVNTSTEAMDAIASGRLHALAGGHFICAAWAAVLIHDHSRGRDFSSESLEFDRPMAVGFDATGARRYQARFLGGFESVNFRQFAKVRNPALKQYDFDFGQLMR